MGLSIMISDEVWPIHNAYVGPIGSSVPLFTACRQRPFLSGLGPMLHDAASCQRCSEPLLRKNESGLTGIPKMTTLPLERCSGEGSDFTSFTGQNGSGDSLATHIVHQVVLLYSDHTQNNPKF